MSSPTAPPAPRITFEPDKSSGILAFPYRLLIRTSLALAVCLGFSLGVYLILGFAFGLPLAPSTPALMQVHGQAQVVGFVTLFIIAVGVQLFPRFHANPLRDPRQVSIGGLILALGILARAVAQPLGTDVPGRGLLLVASGLLELFGAAMVIRAFGHVMLGGVQRPRSWAALLLPVTMGASLILALFLNLFIAVELAQGGLVAPSGRDEALLHLQLWGFAASMVLAVSGRVYPRFLLLRPTRSAWLLRALVLWTFGVFGVALAWLVTGGAPWPRLVATLAQLAGALGFVAAVRLYEPPVRASGMPHVTDPTRLWARVAYGFLLVGAAIEAFAALLAGLGGVSPLTELSAARHALAQGFLLPVMVYMAARILPGYSGEMMRRPRVLSALVWSLFIGAAARVGAELVGGYGLGWGAIAALGGSLAAVAFTVFAVGLWRSAAHQAGA